ncbi:hypothetical protein [Desulfovirgula thermocuniculi]|uniref:hypothetical protein n=1 Tax=Desulfovirgula thermocuniculi TaxID=348842 RepID=UPI000421104C|nr:hypothetical protein [Desulfovirgula thermocuniculi]
MENARILEERLKNIIREISSQTGQEIKRHLLADLEREVAQLLKHNSRQELARFLHLVKGAVEQL